MKSSVEVDFRFGVGRHTLHLIIFVMVISIYIYILIYIYINAEICDLFYDNLCHLRMLSDDLFDDTCHFVCEYKFIFIFLHMHLQFHLI